MTTTTDFVERAVAVICEAQQWMRDHERDDEERWGAALQLVGASADDEALIVRFVEPDGRRINYRWVLRDEGEGIDAFTDPEGALDDLSSNFHEDVLTSERSDPDADGVRWFGDRPGEDENTPEVPPGDEFHWSPSA
jgi:hypothetical protein